MTAPQLACAYMLDLALGDPEWFPHPVRLFGAVTNAAERLLWPVAISPRRQLLAGAGLTAFVVSLAFAIGRPNNKTWRISLAWTALATRSLLTEAASVIAALDSNDLALARLRVARIVGRDTDNLDSTEICRAVLETLAESACDGIVAPLFWLAVLGVPGGMAYKAINTLDSMIGHKDAHYLYFGRAAARLDDAANYLPARLTAALIALAAQLLRHDASACWRVWRRDGRLHASPNAGQSEAAMAGALGVRLGGVNIYAGLPHHTPLLNTEGSPASPLQVKAALSLVAAVSALAFGLAFLFLLVRRRP